MKKFKIGSMVRTGGKFGPIGKVVSYDEETGLYCVESGKSKGWLTVDYLKPYKEYDQLSLFGGVL